MPTSPEHGRRRRRFAPLLSGGTVLAAVVVGFAGIGAGAASASTHHHHPGADGPGRRGALGARVVDGVVASVGTDSFTITRGRLATVAVDVSSSTTYLERGQSSASFSDVAVGERVKVAGTVSSGVLDARKVLLAGVAPVEVRGVVASVGTDRFTVERGGLATIAVEVLTSTAFTEPGVPSATLADLTVGARVEVTGTVSEGALDASTVEITVSPRLAVLGTVASLDSGGFTLSTGSKRVVSVDVSTATTYLEAGVSSPSSSSLAADDEVVVVGSSAGGGTLAATTVVILAS